MKMFSKNLMSSTLQKSSVSVMSSIPKSTKVMGSLLQKNSVSMTSQMPKSTTVMGSFLQKNSVSVTSQMPKSTRVVGSFLQKNSVSVMSQMPKSTRVVGSFLQKNSVNVMSQMPKSTGVKGSFLQKNSVSMTSQMPKSTKVMGSFLQKNSVYVMSQMSKSTEVKGSFLRKNSVSVKSEMPKSTGVVSLHNTMRAKFCDHQNVYSNRTTADLVKMYSLLTLCSWNTFSANAYRIFQKSREVLGEQYFGAIFKPMIYNLYVAGETRSEILGTMKTLEKKNLKPFLSPMLEDDPGIFSSKKIKSEEVHKLNLEIIENCIRLASEGCNSSPKTLAIKLTAFIPTSLLFKIATPLSSDEIRISSNLVDSLTNFFINGETSNVIISDWRKQDIQTLTLAAKELIKICTQCKERGIVLYIDAEYSHLQPAVRLLTLCLMNIFNQPSKSNSDVVVANTYQCYLKQSRSDIDTDLKISKQLGFMLACKVVRGAYLEAETTFSLESWTPNPIHESYQATNENYDSIVQILLHEIAEGKPTFLTIATHNATSILRAVDLMKGLGILKHPSVHFAQINGMSDQLSVGLASLEGGPSFSVLKLVPYGSVDQVLPWLARRVQENASVFHRTEWDRNLIKKELARRFKDIL